MAKTELAEAMSKLLTAATGAATAAHKFNQGYEAAVRQNYLDHLDRQSRWDQMRAARRAAEVPVVPQ